MKTTKEFYNYYNENYIEYFQFNYLFQYDNPISDDILIKLLEEYEEEITLEEFYNYEF